MMRDFNKKKQLKFPKGFLWGSATSAHQVEGGNKNNWSEWEKKNAERLAKEASDKWEKWQQEKFPEMLKPENYISGRACDHYNRYESDFDIAKELGHNAHRFSIEWSRIEPEEGKFDEKEIEHYRKVILALKERGLEPMITLWWWTNPIWIEKIGAWENKKTIEYFLRYVDKITRELKKSGVKFWIPGNEPGTYVGMSYVKGKHPPMIKDLWRANKVFKNILKAFTLAYDEIHSHQFDARVGLSHYARFMVPKTDRLIDGLATKVLDYIKNWRFFKICKKYDFVGIQYYRANTEKITFKNSNIAGFISEVDDVSDWHSDLNWCLYPKGIYYLLKKAGKFGKSIYITENGLADADDNQREKFIQEHLYWVHKAIQEGANVRGYFYWSLLDNFEWDKGFWPRFGLVEIDYKTQERKIRPSALEYTKICRSNELEIEIDEK